MKINKNTLLSRRQLFKNFTFAGLTLPFLSASKTAQTTPLPEDPSPDPENDYDTPFYATTKDDPKLKNGIVKQSAYRQLNHFPWCRRILLTDVISKNHKSPIKYDKDRLSKYSFTSFQSFPQWSLYTEEKEVINTPEKHFRNNQQITDFHELLHLENLMSFNLIKRACRKEHIITMDKFNLMEFDIAFRTLEQMPFDLIVEYITMNPSMYNRIRHTPEFFPREDMEDWMDVYKGVENAPDDIKDITNLRANLWCADIVVTPLCPTNEIYLTPEPACLGVISVYEESAVHHPVSSNFFEPAFKEFSVAVINDFAVSKIIVNC